MRAPLVLRVKVTPDPDAAAALERKRAALSFAPVNGFHRDIRQPKQQTDGYVSDSFVDQLFESRTGRQAG